MDGRWALDRLSPARLVRGFVEPLSGGGGKRTRERFRPTVGIESAPDSADDTTRTRLAAVFRRE
jgi:hypothetical protein